MKKVMLWGAVGVLSLVIGNSVSAADFSGRHMCRGEEHHMTVTSCMAGDYVRPALGMIAVRCGAEECGVICEKRNEYCKNYAENSYGISRGGGHHSERHGRGCHRW